MCPIEPKPGDLVITWDNRSGKIFFIEVWTRDQVLVMESGTNAVFEDRTSFAKQFPISRNVELGPGVWKYVYQVV